MTHKFKKSSKSVIMISKNININKDSVNKNKTDSIHLQTLNSRGKLITERLSVFITFESIIIAGLLVWAQYWGDTYDRYINLCPPEPVWHVALMISIIFVAILSSILSVVFSLFSFNKMHNNGLPRLSVTLAGVSLFSMICMILFSLLGLFDSIIQNNVWHASILVKMFEPYNSEIRTLSIIIILATGILLYCCSEKIVKRIFVE